VIKSIRFAIFSIFATLIISACGASQTPRVSATADKQPSFKEEVSIYYPMAVGNSWTYQGSMLGITTSNQVAIVKKEGLAFIDSSGSKMQVDAYGLRDQKRYLLRGPLVKGTSWMSVTSVSAVERYAIISIGDTVQVPAGQFTGCLTVRSSTRLNQRRMLINDIVFAPKVGIISISTFMLEDNSVKIPQVDLRLASYKVLSDN
jgi:hypothetical protein